MCQPKMVLQAKGGRLIDVLPGTQTQLIYSLKRRGCAAATAAAAAGFRRAIPIMPRTVRHAQRQEGSTEPGFIGSLVPGPHFHFGLMF